MACRCQKHKPGAAAAAENATPTDYTTLPEEPCDICAEKHFSTAFALANEKGYADPQNFDRIIGELTCATWHTFEAHRELAEKLRDLRHYIQLRRQADNSRWLLASLDFKELLKFKQEEWLCSGETFPDFKETVWIISNCEYSKTKLVPAGPDDLLVFLNKAKSLSWYDHQHMAVFHRSPEEGYGDDKNKKASHFYCFKGKGKNVQFIPPSSIRELKAAYDWNYPIEEGKVRSATTGYMVAEFLKKILPSANIVLVNFGYRVEKSSYRCPWHNWQFEAKQLEKYQHFYTAEVKNE